MKEVLSLFGEGASPFIAAEAHADECLRAVEALADVLSASGSERTSATELVRACESRADEMKIAIRRQLAGKWFLPVPRAQLLDLINRQDKIANCAKDVAQLIEHRFETLPSDITEILQSFLAASLRVVRQSHKSVHEFDELITTGFRGAEADRVVAMVERLDELESQSDAEQWRLFGQMKQVEDQVSPIDAMFLYRVTTLIAKIGDHADRTGRLLEQMLTK